VPSSCGATLAPDVDARAPAAGAPQGGGAGRIGERGRSERSHASGGAHPVHSRMATSCWSTLRSRRAVNRAKTARRSAAVASMRSVHCYSPTWKDIARAPEREALLRGPHAREGDDEGAVVRVRAHLTRSPDPPAAAATAGW
jgi:hypothetical protein